MDANFDTEGIFNFDDTYPFMDNAMDEIEVSEQFIPEAPSIYSSLDDDWSPLAFPTYMNEEQSIPSSSSGVYSYSTTSRSSFGTSIDEEYFTADDNHVTESISPSPRSNACASKVKKHRKKGEATTPSHMKSLHEVIGVPLRDQITEAARQWLHKFLEGGKLPTEHVTLNSTTPYTDAINTKKKKVVKTASGAMDHIVRPTNSFMTYSFIRRPHYKELHNARISKLLADEWAKLAEEMKEPFKIESQRLKELHQIQFRDYKYEPKKKKDKLAKRVATQKVVTATGKSKGRRQIKAETTTATKLANSTPQAGKRGRATTYTRKSCAKAGVKEVTKRGPRATKTTPVPSSPNIPSSPESGTSLSSISFYSSTNQVRATQGIKSQPRLPTYTNHFAAMLNVVPATSSVPMSFSLLNGNTVIQVLNQNIFTNPPPLVNSTEYIEIDIGSENSSIYDPTDFNALFQYLGEEQEVETTETPSFTDVALADFPEVTMDNRLFGGLLD